MATWEAPGSGKTNTWLTPRWIIDIFGPFDLDPCAHPGWETAYAHFFEEQNGLYRNWGGLVWCNPPYGRNTADWVQRWLNHGDGLLLVANRSDSSWWQDAAKGSSSIWFPKGRISFLNHEGREQRGTAFASVMFGIGPHADERLMRAKHLGTILKKSTN